MESPGGFAEETVEVRYLFSGSQVPTSLNCLGKKLTEVETAASAA